MRASVAQPLNGVFGRIASGSGDGHLENTISGDFAQINVDGPDPNKRGTNEPPHEVTLRFQFVRRDTGQPISIPWMQFTFFDFDETTHRFGPNMYTQEDGDGREARAPLPTPALPTPPNPDPTPTHPCGNPYRAQLIRTHPLAPELRLRLAVRFCVGICPVRALPDLLGD